MLNLPLHHTYVQSCPTSALAQLQYLYDSFSENFMQIKQTKYTFL